MTLFEFISVACSLVLALALSRGLNGIRSVFFADRRYWPHAIWLVTKLLNTVTYWWWLWAYNEMHSFWNILTFLLYLSVPVGIYLQVDSLVGHHPREIRDWRERYFDEHKWFFGLNGILAILVFVVFSNVLTPGDPNLVGSIWMLISLVYSAIGFKSNSSKTHWVIACLAFTTQLLFLMSLFDAPSLE